MTIAIAITNRRLIRFTYDRQPRVVEPHTYGRNKKGALAVRGYQVGGGSNSGRPEGWRIFLERDMEMLTMTQEQFSGPRPDYERGDSMFSHIVAEL
jgi:hypothetical protein